jgi:hypothetical protein
LFFLELFFELFLFTLFRLFFPPVEALSCSSAFGALVLDCFLPFFFCDGAPAFLALAPLLLFFDEVLLVAFGLGFEFEFLACFIGRVALAGVFSTSVGRAGAAAAASDLTPSVHAPKLQSEPGASVPPLVQAPIPKPQT